MAHYMHMEYLTPRVLAKGQKAFFFFKIEAYKAKAKQEPLTSLIKLNHRNCHAFFQLD